jgi:hypothetical protein
MEGIFVPISFFLALFAILYVYYTTRSRERLALIEKGASANIFKMDPTESRLNLVKWGIFLIGLSVGVITGYALSTVINEVVAFFTTILLTGGIALIVAYIVINKMGDNK